MLLFLNVIEYVSKVFWYNLAYHCTVIPVDHEKYLKQSKQTK